jgi:hypothetical protein
MADEQEDCQQADLAAWWQSECQIALRRAAAAESALAELRGRTCGTCVYCILDWENELTNAACANASIPGHSVAIVSCRRLGFTCGAWAPKEQP